VVEPAGVLEDGELEASGWSPAWIVEFNLMLSVADTGSDAASF
jgi:hypothetical protein